MKFRVFPNTRVRRSPTKIIQTLALEKFYHVTETAAGVVNSPETRYSMLSH